MEREKKRGVGKGMKDGKYRERNDQRQTKSVRGEEGRESRE